MSLATTRRRCPPSTPLPAAATITPQPPLHSTATTEHHPHHKTTTAATPPPWLSPATIFNHHGCHHSTNANTHCRCYNTVGTTTKSTPLTTQPPPP
nr:hypothetical protein [Tanacetum cinerariifolium]